MIQVDYACPATLSFALPRPAKLSDSAGTFQDIAVRQVGRQIRHKLLSLYVGQQLFCLPDEFTRFGYSNHNDSLK